MNTAIVIYIPLLKFLEKNMAHTVHGILHSHKQTNIVTFMF